MYISATYLADRRRILTVALLVRCCVCRRLSVTWCNNNNNNRLYSTPDTPQAGVQRHHTDTGMRGAGVAPVGCQPQGPTCRQPITANTAPVVHLSQPKLVPTLLLGGQGTCVWTTYPRLLRGMPRPGIELATFRSRVASANHWATALNGARPRAKVCPKSASIIP